MHKADVRILKMLLEKGCTSPLKSYSIFQLLEIIPVSYSKMYNALSSLNMGEYVEKGCKNSRANTYFITSKGVEKLKELVK